MAIDVTSLLQGNATTYFPRRLTNGNASLLANRVDEEGLLELDGPKIVLGEPGMGKSELMRELGRRLGVEPVTATRFMNARNPTKLVPVGKPLLIDALDEAMARREGDAIDAILAQLEEAGSPAFILSCRSREWQARSVTNLRQLYGTDPEICTLEPLTRGEALHFFEVRYPKIDAEHVLNHLEQHALGELYRNPLTLGLMGRVAESDAQLPATRAALFDRVCRLIWPEHDPDRQDAGLAQLGENEALDAAGAIAASLLFAGSEAASSAGAAQLQEGDLRLADIERLPHAGAAGAIFSSKLFHSIGTARAKPIHRVIAEFLGAHWLARRASTPRAQRRLLAQLHGSSGVPASLRGLHAWLAYHSAAMADAVIAADPYGVLRYGEPAAFTPHEADKLFDALCALAEDDPYFRAADWDSRTATALMVPELKSRIDAIICSATSSSHLRSLLIEGLNGTALAGELADTLEAVMLSSERFYREREDAADALLPHRERSWWQATIARLCDKGDPDATHLARNLIEKFDAGVPNAVLVSTIFAEMGVTISPLPRRTGRHVHSMRHYDRVLDLLNPPRLVEVLDLVADYAGLLRGSDWQNANDVGEIMAHLIVRGIDESVIDADQGPALWRWLGTVEHARRFHGDIKKELGQRLGAHPELRHAVQAFALNHARRADSVWATAMDLHRRLVGISAHAEDLVRAFDQLATGNLKDQTLRKDWCDLVRLAWGPEGIEAAVLAAAERFSRGDKQLAAFLHKMENPKKSPWEAKQEREAERRERKRRVTFAVQRRQYESARDKLRAGALGSILAPAQAYLGRFNDLSREEPPIERVAEWLGPALRDDALVGFEAVLHRSDVPSVTDVADGFAKGTVYNFCFPIMAGLYERMRIGKGIADLPPTLETTGLLLCHNDHGWEIEEDLPALRDALEAAVVPTQQARETFARAWIEPSLATGSEHVAGLYKLAHDPEWQATGGALAAGWLATFPDVPEAVEASLVDCLTHAGALQALAQVVATPANTVFRNFDHMLAWLAIDVLVRFNAVRPHLEGIGKRNPEFLWFLRNRLVFERRGRMLPLTISQATWIIAEFREHWPYVTLEGSGSGNTNPYDATDFLRALLNRIADDTGVEAGDAMQALIAAPADSYSELIRHMAAEQRQKRAEEDFCAVTPAQLGELLADGPPANIEDLKSLVREEIDIAQKKLLGEDIDQVRDFWTDTGVPRDENRCRDRLAAIIGPELARYDILRITEADMPMTKRADLAYARNPLQLPMEVKGQWHNDVWDAASGQLDVKYLVDWRSEQRGIYCVLWFGDVPSASKRRLKPHPDGRPAPTSGAAMRDMLIERIPDARRALIDVEVLDLSAGKPTPKVNKASAHKKGRRAAKRKSAV
jgi:hypothetical protein